MDRTERQKSALRKWVQAGCRACLEFPTGFGKTRTALMAIKLLSLKYPDLSVLVVVPTELLQTQWNTQLLQNGLSLNCEVKVINTAIKSESNPDFLIIDEVHRAAAVSLSQIFEVCHYKYILGLTATLERLDGRHKIIERYCPICDKVTTIEAVANGWLSDYIEYKVILNVDNISDYENYNRQFNVDFEYFGFNFDLAMKMVGPQGFKARTAYKNMMLQVNPTLDPKEIYKQITYHATSLMRQLQLRKKFINEHPDKIRLAQEIIKARPNSKIITFSSTINVADKIGLGDTYSGKDSKKRSSVSISNFSKAKTGVLNTVSKANEGLDVPGLNCVIILGQDSSKTKFTQRLGRAIRFEAGKTAEIFTFVIANTCEENWFAKSHEGRTWITIDEENLMKVLRHEPYEEYKQPVIQKIFRM